MSVTLVAFSGGLDSFALAMQLLQKKEKVWFHHFHLLNQLGRTDPEAMAWENFKRWAMERYAKRCAFTEQILDMRFLPVIPSDIKIFRFMLGIICSTTPDITEVAFGRQKDDEDDDCHDEYMAEFQIGKNLSPARLTFPILKKTKKQLYRSLPKQLRESWWSCRQPKYLETGIYACGLCEPCEKLKKYNIKHPRVLRRTHAPTQDCRSN